MPKKSSYDEADRLAAEFINGNRLSTADELKKYRAIDAAVMALTIVEIMGCDNAVLRDFRRCLASRM